VREPPVQGEKGDRRRYEAVNGRRGTARRVLKYLLVQTRDNREGVGAALDGRPGATVPRDVLDIATEAALRAGAELMSRYGRPPQGTAKHGPTDPGSCLPGAFAYLEGL